MASLQEVAEVMAFLSSLHPERQVTPDTMRAYHLVLYDIDADMLRAAAVQLGATSRWFPKPEEIRKEVRHISSGNKLDSGEEAWVEVARTIRKVGLWGTPTWPNSRIQEAVDAMGGWHALCSSTNAPADRAHFIKVYNAIAARDEREDISHPAIKELTGEVRDRLKAFTDTRLSLPDGFRKRSGG